MAFGFCRLRIFCQLRPTSSVPTLKLCKLKTQWIGINQIIEDLAFEASVAMFIGLIEDLQVQGQQGQHLTFHI
ncbi:hypothetical protein M8J77_021730 [Diaphorina citri]|nr:hypothetical protein M8J77_021730 [Diaphorina citri]